MPRSFRPPSGAAFSIGSEQGNAWIAQGIPRQGRRSLPEAGHRRRSTRRQSPELRADVVAAIVAAYNEIARPGFPSIRRRRCPAAVTPRRVSEKRRSLPGHGAAPAATSRQGALSRSKAGASKSASTPSATCRTRRSSRSACCWRRGMSIPASSRWSRRKSPATKLSKRRILAYVLRRHGHGVLRANLSVRDRIMLLLRG